ncbi:hypothetical protein [uncultured Paracoccus sp.]|uniref:hypothetical protein n=1 Tax=uncultured Paracoccus sp. TaxID=189685 RepID=UPI0025D5C0B2|nr:hypothetical protein [uncultured Paracoccus sp.]
MIPLRRKIGAPFRGALQFEDDQWANLPEDVQIVAAIRQGGVRHAGSVSRDVAQRLFAFEVDTKAVEPGRAFFDIWVAGEPVPGSRNVVIDFFEGAAA